MPAREEVDREKEMGQNGEAAADRDAGNGYGARVTRLVIGPERVTPSPEQGSVTVILGSAPVPDVEIFRDDRYRDGTSAGVRCGCGAVQEHTRLADMRVYVCPHCGTIIARTGRKFTAARW